MHRFRQRCAEAGMCSWRVNQARCWPSPFQTSLPGRWTPESFVEVALRDACPKSSPFPVRIDLYDDATRLRCETWQSCLRETTDGRLQTTRSGNGIPLPAPLWTSAQRRSLESGIRPRRARRRGRGSVEKTSNLKDGFPGTNRHACLVRANHGCHHHIAIRRLIRQVSLHALERESIIFP
jgi:hypothetical protein